MVTSIPATIQTTTMVTSIRATIMATIQAITTVMSIRATALATVMATSTRLPVVSSRITFQVTKKVTKIYLASVVVQQSS
jgi:hypothetical protein